MDIQQITSTGRKEVINEVVAKLRFFSHTYNLISLFICGGYCRSLILKNTETIEDIDVASAYPNDAIRLCGFFSSEFLKEMPVFYHRTGTGSVEYQGIRIEFQNESINSYMHNEEVVNWMRKNHISPTPLMNNIYGRDFTINSLIFSLKTGELYDLTRKAINDFKKKMIVPLLPAEILIKYSPMSILRAIRFAIQYDFIIVPELRSEMKKNKQKLTDSYSRERISKEIEKILKINTKTGLEQLQKYNLTSLIVPEQLSKYVNIKEKRRDKID